MKRNIDDVIKCFERNNKNYAAAGRELGITRERVRQLLSPIGVNSIKRLTPERIEKTKESLKRTRHYDISSIELGVSVRSLMFFKKKYLKGLKMVVRRRKPPQIKKYTRELVAKMYEKHKGNYRKMQGDPELGCKNVSDMMRRRGFVEEFPSIGRQTNPGSGRKSKIQTESDLKSLYEAHKGSYRDMAKATGVNTWAISNRINKLGFKEKYPNLVNTRRRRK